MFFKVWLVVCVVSRWNSLLRRRVNQQITCLTVDQKAHASSTKTVRDSGDLRYHHSTTSTVSISPSVCELTWAPCLCSPLRSLPLTLGIRVKTPDTSRSALWMTLSRWALSWCSETAKREKSCASWQSWWRRCCSSTLKSASRPQRCCSIRFSVPTSLVTAGKSRVVRWGVWAAICGWGEL